jgi:hypothetical protein
MVVVVTEFGAELRVWDDCRDDLVGGPVARYAGGDLRRGKDSKSFEFRDPRRRLNESIQSWTGYAMRPESVIIKDEAKQSRMNKN